MFLLLPRRNRRRKSHSCWRRCRPSDLRAPGSASVKLINPVRRRHFSRVAFTINAATRLLSLLAGSTNSSPTAPTCSPGRHAGRERHGFREWFRGELERFTASDDICAAGGQPPSAHVSHRHHSVFGAVASFPITVSILRSPIRCSFVTRRPSRFPRSPTRHEYFPFPPSATAGAAQFP